MTTSPDLTRKYGLLVNEVNRVNEMRGAKEGSEPTVTRKKFLKAVSLESDVAWSLILACEQSCLYRQV